MIDLTLMRDFFPLVRARHWVGKRNVVHINKEKVLFSNEGISVPKAK